MANVNKLGKFEIIAKIGQGAMGVVYKARDPFIDRIVALKTITTGLTEDRNLLKRFYSEARSAGSLRHPNIVTIYELGHEGDMPFIAMQFLEGESLDKLIDRLPNLPLSQKIGFIVYVCRALDYAHKQTPPVIHRDIKPGNVMVAPDGSVVVVDFGIARLGESTVSQSAGLLIGTLGYMSPQLFRGATADARSDIWASGVMFYELLAYRRPFKGDSAAALMSSIVFEEQRSILEAAPGTPEDIKAILDRMLAKDVESRYQSMEEVLADLEPIWKRLLHSDIAIFLENSQRLYQEGDLLAAKSEIALILHWDPSHSGARGLSERINSELRRQQVFPQVKARLESAQKLLAEGRNEEAKSEAEAALKLDSSFQPAREIVRQAQIALERMREIARAIHSSKQRMAEGAFTEAETQLDKVLTLDPGNLAAQEQLKQIHDERSRRERGKQRDSLLQRARTFWTKLEYDDCVNLLLSAGKEFPGDPEISKFLDAARHDQAEHRRQVLFAEIRNQLSTQQFEAALNSLEAFLAQSPSDPTANSLRTHALQGLDRQQRERRLNEGKSELRASIKNKNYQEAIARGEELQREFPSDGDLSELVVFARAEQSQLEQRRRLEQFTLKIQKEMDRGRFAEATQAAEKALGEFPKNAEILPLLDRARKEQAEKEEQALLKQRLREVERLLERQQLTEAIDLARQSITTIGPDPRLADTLQRALKEREFREQKQHRQDETLQKARRMLDESNIADAASLLNVALETKLFQADDPRIKKLFGEIDEKQLPPQSPIANLPPTSSPATSSASPETLSSPSNDSAKDYIYMRGVPSLEEPGQARQNAATAGASTSSWGGNPMLSPSFSPSASSAPTPFASSSSTSKAGPGPSVNAQQLLGPIEKYLTTFLGPMTGIIVQRAASKAKDHEELFTLLASMLPLQKDRQAFLARKNEFLRGVALFQPGSESPTGGSAAHAAITLRAAQLTPEEIRHACDLLARHVGPVSRILTERAASRADSLRSLYLTLAGHLKEGAERSNFLREAGFPES